MQPNDPKTEIDGMVESLNEILAQENDDNKEFDHLLEKCKNQRIKSFQRSLSFREVRN